APIATQQQHQLQQQQQRRVHLPLLTLEALAFLGNTRTERTAAHIGGGGVVVRWLWGVVLELMRNCKWQNRPSRYVNSTMQEQERLESKEYDRMYV
ncbi:unnamed protein product, partial [Ceratitis capitata]